MKENHEKKLPIVKTILSEVKQYKKASFLTPVFMLLEVAMEMIIPLLMTFIIDKGVEKGDMSVIVKVGLVMIAVAFVGLFAGVMGGKYGALASTGLARNLRQDMFKKINSYSFSNIDKFSTGSLVTRMTTDVTNIQNAYQMIIRMGVRAPMSLIIAMTLSFFINARLAMIYLYAVIILAAFIALISFGSKGFFEKMFKQYDKLNSVVQENINGIRVVKAYVREDYEDKKFKKISDKIFSIGVKVESLMATMSPVMMVMVYGSIIMISWLGAKMIVQSELTTGELMSLLTYCMNILMSLMMLSFVLVMILMSSAGMKRVTEVLLEKPDISDPENPIYKVDDGSIRFDHVNFQYTEDAEEPVLKDIDFSIKSGETIGIMGGTGSAKSTLVNLISRLYDVTSGRILVGDYDVREYDVKTLRDEVSVVLQQNILFSGTIEENLRWGNKNASMDDIKKACREACADEFIEKFPDGYDTYIDQGGTNVSGGQRQRLCIARALLKKPKILILDDSTSAVDTATDSKIRKAFREEIPDTTKLIISQRITSVMDADRILILDDGKVSGFDTSSNLLKTNKIYQDIYKAQTEGGYGDFDQEKGGL